MILFHSKSKLFSEQQTLLDHLELNNLEFWRWQHNMGKLLRVDGHSDLVRDNHSHAILNNNTSAYETAKKRAEEAQRQRDEIRETAREINNLKCEMHEIKSLLKQLVEEK